jgi:large subunit ribosomal protein L37Ae
MKTTKRFGARYGKRVKDRLQAIEELQKKKQKCPYCRKERVKRLALGIFTCTKCGAKFTGRAYSVVQPKPEVEQVQKQEIEEEPQEEESFDEEDDMPEEKADEGEEDQTEQVSYVDSDEPDEEKNG